MRRLVRDQLSDRYQHERSFPEEVQKEAKRRLTAMLDAHLFEYTVETFDSFNFICPESGNPGPPGYPCEGGYGNPGSPGFPWTTPSELSLFNLDEFSLAQVTRINAEFDPDHSYLTPREDQFLAYLLITFPRSTDDLIWLLEFGFPLDRVFYYEARNLTSQNLRERTAPLVYNMLTIASSISDAAIELLLTLDAKSCSIDIPLRLSKFLRYNSFPNLVVRKRWEHLTESYLLGDDATIFQIRKRGLYRCLVDMACDETTSTYLTKSRNCDHLALYRKRRALDYFALADESDALDKLKVCKTVDDLHQLIDNGFPLKKYLQEINQIAREIGDDAVLLLHRILRNVIPSEGK